jgi:hypothetical protein
VVRWVGPGDAGSVRTERHGLVRTENPFGLRVGTGEEVLSPRWGWVSFVGQNPALTRWAIIWRPSGPVATAPRPLANTGVGLEEAMPLALGQARAESEMKSAQAANDPK